MKVIITFTFCCDNLWKSKFMALEKPGKLREFLQGVSVTASPVLATIGKPSVCPSVCHMRALSENDGRGMGCCFRAISLFLCQQHYEKTAGPICMTFSGKVWSDHGTT